MRDRHRTHREWRKGLEQLDLFVRAQSDVSEDTPAWHTLPVRTRWKATELIVQLMLDHTPDPGDREAGATRHDV